MTDLPEQIQRILKEVSVDHPDWRAVYQLAVLLEREEITKVKSLRRRLGQWREWKAGRKQSNGRV